VSQKRVNDNQGLQANRTCGNLQQKQRWFHVLLGPNYNHFHIQLRWDCNKFQKLEPLQLQTQSCDIEHPFTIKFSGSSYKRFLRANHFILRKPSNKLQDTKVSGHLQIKNQIQEKEILKMTILIFKSNRTSMIILYNNTRWLKNTSWHFFPQKDTLL
jgi:hypothetical protein